MRSQQHWNILELRCNHFSLMLDIGYLRFWSTRYWREQRASAAAAFFEKLSIYCIWRPRTVWWLIGSKYLTYLSLRHLANGDSESGQAGTVVCNYRNGPAVRWELLTVVMRLLWIIVNCWSTIINCCRVSQKHLWTPAAVSNSSPER